MIGEMTVRDVYLRFDKGPVRSFRVWDAQRLVTARVEEGIANKDVHGKPAPVIVSVATAADYKAERKGRR